MPEAALNRRSANRSIRCGESTSCSTDPAGISNPFYIRTAERVHLIRRAVTISFSISAGHTHVLHLGRRRQRWQLHHLPYHSRPKLPQTITRANEAHRHRPARIAMSPLWPAVSFASVAGVHTSDPRTQQAARHRHRRLRMPSGHRAAHTYSEWVQRDLFLDRVRI